MKRCPKCGLEKEESEFPVNRTKPGGRGCICRKCHSEYTKANYKVHARRYKARNVAHKRAMRAWLNGLKKSLSCMRCGEKHIACLSFHHRDASRKECNVSNAVNQGWGIERTKREIAKCDVLCENCHRKQAYDLKYPGYAATLTEL